VRALLRHGDEAGVLDALLDCAGGRDAGTAPAALLTLRNMALAPELVAQAAALPRLLPALVAAAEGAPGWGRAYGASALWGALLATRV